MGTGGNSTVVWRRTCGVYCLFLWFFPQRDNSRSSCAMNRKYLVSPLQLLRSWLNVQVTTTGADLCSRGMQGCCHPAETLATCTEVLPTASLTLKKGFLTPAL